ncbi:protein-ADP-ribose hydrolase [Parasporobacterium paucivorans]|uniref:O-acetyl-ADP-ribose deacetylase (Regulator of RNase III), contains Macro domain n=1 Tax=Parasporobacterium paucivorans DSM 15970 TaxID=1122934 RepID=A0A1M6JHE2_9FIRM|nr:protein-ADP-ribose hydrolase [Parasporobacterium paucivorans]SHJ46139.1 O-acetyl-ADP-ribose deacetylase (regulator of RNase III), contains Macro domain [Parasporobacterium paucivorans DSM 15970]
MSHRSQNEKLEWIVKELCIDSGKYKDLKVSRQDRRNIMRSLMNIRMPRPISNEFLEIQDDFLRQESFEKGIVKLETIPTIWEECHSSHPFSNKISIWQGDITRLQVDAIVNAANSQMLGCFVPCHGCIDNAIHSSAGIQLREECFRYMNRKKNEDRNYEEPTGEALLTGAYNLPSRYVLHTVGPIVRNQLNESLKEELRSCYRSCIDLAVKYGIRSIAFCCISTGEFRFPNVAAADIAIEVIGEKLQEFRDQIDRVIFNVYKEIDLELYIKGFSK